VRPPRPPRHQGVGVVLGLALAPLALAGCGGGPDEETTLDVLAAASLTEPFEQLADDFEADHPGVTVRLSFGSSAALAQQVTEGAPSDVLATADRASMELAAADVGAPVEFATNELVLVTATGADIRSLGDLAGDVSYVTCVVSAPCGALAAELLERNDVAAEPVSRETDVKAVLAKVVSGEVDAGLVYVTDARAAGDAVTTVEVPGAESLPNPYLVALVDASPQATLAQEWVDAVLGPEGRALLDAAGFGPAGSAGTS
jgi:molybdate transport system substrate-binding protein